VKTIAEEQLITFLDRKKIGVQTCFAVRKSHGSPVKDFLDLATKVAHLSFSNPNYVLLYRGQRQDFKRTNHKGIAYSTLKPTLFRGASNPSSTELRRRFETLKRAEEELLLLYERKHFPDVERLQRQQILRWAIIQHYEICPTPLLDVTNSLRIAVSFASDHATGDAFVLILGVPNLSGAITASAEAGLQIVRLSSVCPPAAVRPHIQEGYLLGEYPEMTGYDQKQFYAHYEIDFGRRLLAKFKFNVRTFWKNSDFPRIERAALYPDENDPLFELAQSIRQRLR
jgi:hypothetical protein